MSQFREHSRRAAPQRFTCFKPGPTPDMAQSTTSTTPDPMSGGVSPMEQGAALSLGHQPGPAESGMNTPTSCSHPSQDDRKRSRAADSARQDVNRPGHTAPLILNSAHCSGTICQHRQPRSSAISPTMPRGRTVPDDVMNPHPNVRPLPTMRQWIRTLFSPIQHYSRAGSSVPTCPRRQFWSIGELRTMFRGRTVPEGAANPQPGARPLPTSRQSPRTIFSPPKNAAARAAACLPAHAASFRASENHRRCPAAEPSPTLPRSPSQADGSHRSAFGMTSPQGSGAYSGTLSGLPSSRARTRWHCAKVVGRPPHSRAPHRHCAMSGCVQTTISFHPSGG